MLCHGLKCRWLHLFLEHGKISKAYFLHGKSKVESHNTFCKRDFSFYSLCIPLSYAIHYATSFIPLWSQVWRCDLLCPREWEWKRQGRLPGQSFKRLYHSFPSVLRPACPSCSFNLCPNTTKAILGQSCGVTEKDTSVMLKPRDFENVCYCSRTWPAMTN